jgi:mono/diheme cytochrome c family protein
MRGPAALVALLAAAAAPAAAQDVRAGSFTYFNFCSGCHGAEGQGDGPTAAVLTVSPPDLTTIAARAGGAFPAARVVARIEGTDPLAAHGGPMPLYGGIFEGAEPAILETEAGMVETDRIVLDLLAFLESIQESP